MVSRSARNLVSGAVGFLLIPLFLRYLGPEQYGIWVLAQTIVFYLNFLEFGLTPTLTRYLAATRGSKNYEGVNRILGQLSVLMGAVAILIALLTLLGAFLFPFFFPTLASDQGRLFRYAFLLIGLQAAIGMAMKIWEGTLGAMEDYHVLNGLYILAALARLGYSLILLWLGYGLIALLSAQFFVLIILWLSEHLYLRHHYPQLSFRCQWHGWESLKPLLNFSGAFFLTRIAGSLGNDFNKIIAGVLLGPTAVTFYQIGYKIHDLARRIFGNATAVLMPTAANLSTRGETERLRRLLCHTSAVMVGIIGAIYIPLIFYGNQIIYLWVGPNYPDASQILMFLSFALLMTAHNRALGPVLWGIGNYRVILGVALLGSATQTLLAIGLCLWWGVIGLALATFLTTVPFHLFLTWYACRQFQLSLWDYAGRPWVGLIMAATVGLGSGTVLSFLSPSLSWVSVSLKLFLFEIGFWAVFPLIGFPPPLRRQLRQVFASSLLPQKQAVMFDDL